MSLIRLLRREMRTSARKMVVISGLAGASNAVILASVNSGAQMAARGTPSFLTAMTFLIALLINLRAQHYLMTVSTAEIEAIIHKMRVRLLDQARRSELRELEGVGRATIVSIITKETAALSQVSTILALTTQALVLVFCTAIYIAYQSFLAFMLSVLLIGVSALLYVARNRKVSAQRREAFQWEGQFLDRMLDLLDGFKEARLNRARSDALFDDIDQVSRTAANIKIRTQTEMLRQAVFSQTSFYILLAALTFVVPAFDPAVGPSVVKTTTAVLFIIGACWGLINSVPILSAANAAATNIEELSAKFAATATELPPSPHQAQFQQISLREVTFRYKDKYSETTFQIGPLDFDLRAGEIVFITGGNGSGKSSFLKVLASLYPPDSGKIYLDGKIVDESSREDYRALIAAIFSDYHLFQHTYGIADPDPAEIDRLLAELGLQDKTGLTGRRVPHHRPLGGAAQTPRADRQPAREPAYPAARRMDSRPGRRVSGEVLQRVIADAAPNRYHRRPYHPRRRLFRHAAVPGAPTSHGRWPDHRRAQHDGGRRWPRTPRHLLTHLPRRPTTSGGGWSSTA